MNQPPEVLALQTNAERLAHDIAQACASIRRDWPHMLPRNAPAQRLGGGSRSAQITAADHAPTDSDIDPLTRLVSLRRLIVDVLNGWSRVVIEDRPITSSAVPDGRSAPDMCAFLERHAQWMSGHEAATDCAEEVSDLARRAHQVTNPARREWIALGDCPLPWVDEEGNETRCGGTVRAWPRARLVYRSAGAAASPRNCSGRRCRRRSPAATARKPPPS